MEATKSDPLFISAQGGESFRQFWREVRSKDYQDKLDRDVSVLVAMRTNSSHGERDSAFVVEKVRLAKAIQKSEAGFKKSVTASVQALLENSRASDALFIARLWLNHAANWASHLQEESQRRQIEFCIPFELRKANTDLPGEAFAHICAGVAASLLTFGLPEFDKWINRSAVHAALLSIRENWNDRKAQVVLSKALDALECVTESQFKIASVEEGSPPNVLKAPTPETPITGYIEIFAALERPYTKEATRAFRRNAKNGKIDCPVKFGKNGERPTVLKSELLIWARKVEEAASSVKRRRVNITSTLKESYQHGPDSRDTRPGISGHVKKRT